jgi:TonB family protein
MAVAVLGATIKTDGTFDELSALGGDRDFEEAALDAVHQWVYTPATLNGTPVDARVFVTVDSHQGKLHAKVEPDLPFPTEPREPVENQISRGELFRVERGKVKPPKGTYVKDPEYSEPARAAKYQGVGVLGVIVGADGNPHDVWVSKKLGLGLDQRAIEAVRQWKFKPATKDGESVAVVINVEVTFRLY